MSTFVQLPTDIDKLNLPEWRRRARRSVAYVLCAIGWLAVIAMLIVAWTCTHCATNEKVYWGAFIAVGVWTSVWTFTVCYIVK